MEEPIASSLVLGAELTKSKSRMKRFLKINKEVHSEISQKNGLCDISPPVKPFPSVCVPAARGIVSQRSLGREMDKCRRQNAIPRCRSHCQRGCLLRGQALRLLSQTLRSWARRRRAPPENPRGHWGLAGSDEDLSDWKFLSPQHASDHFGKNSSEKSLFLSFQKITGQKSLNANHRSGPHDHTLPGLCISFYPARDTRKAGGQNQGLSVKEGSP